MFPGTYGIWLWKNKRWSSSFLNFYFLNFNIDYALFLSIKENIKISTLPPFYFVLLQKQLWEVFYKTSYSPSCLLESLFNKVVGAQACNLIAKRLQDKCFSVNIGNFLGTPILKNTCERLLLIMAIWPCFSRKYAIQSRSNKLFWVE